MRVNEILRFKFKILSEEDEEIDIEAIKIENELSISANYRMIMNLIKAVKQLNKQMKVGDKDE